MVAGDERCGGLGGRSDLAGVDLAPLAPSGEAETIAKKLVTIAHDGAGHAFFDRLVDAVRRAGVTVITGGSNSPLALRLNLSPSDRPAFLRAIEPLVEPDPDILVLTRETNISPWPEFVRRKRTDAVDIAITRGETDSERFIARIEIAYWRPVERFGRTRVTANRPSGIVSRVPDFDAFGDIGDLSSLLGGYRNPLAHDFPIDVVYTWVDGSDPQWAAEKARFAAASGKTVAGSSRAGLDERFRNRDELKYSLRSIEMFAPFVRNIFLVTSGHAPDWLVEDHPRLKRITHREIYDRPADLPTFNSSGIETQLHRIPGLAEHFVYFNDDMMLGSPVEPGDFFTPSGAAVFYPSDNHIVPEVAPSDLEEYAQADVNAIRLFREQFGISPTAVMQHAPYTARISTMRELEQAFPKEFAQCAANRFRDPTDLRPVSFMHPHYASYRGTGVPRPNREGYFGLWYRDIAERFAKTLRTRRYKFICLNDAGVPAAEAARVDATVRKFLDAYYPVKSSFER